jgi:hypothetical protein
MKTSSLMTRCVASILLATCLSSSLDAAPALTSAAPAPLWGPPIICHALDAGTELVLPLGAGAFDVDTSFDRRRTVALTESALALSDDSFVHMETLRRAVVYLAQQNDSPGGRAADELFEMVQARCESTLEAVSTASAKEVAGARAAWALAAFDLAWTLEGLAECGVRPRTSWDPQRCVQLALTARPDDPALRLGASILCFARGDTSTLYVHLDRALAGVHGASDLLGRNISNTMGSFLGARRHDDLVALVARALDRA